MNVCVEREVGAQTKAPAPDRWGKDGRGCATAEFPLDLRRWAPPSSVVVWIEEAIHALTRAPDQGPDQTSGRVTRLENASALRLLSLGYATGTYDSDRIAQLTRSDPLFRVLSENQAPFAAELSIARRRYRAELVAVIGHVLMRALAGRLKVPLELLPGARRQDAIGAAVERVDIARHMDNRE